MSDSENTSQSTLVINANNPAENDSGWSEAGYEYLAERRVRPDETDAFAILRNDCGTLYLSETALPTPEQL